MNYTIVIIQDNPTITHKEIWDQLRRRYTSQEQFEQRLEVFCLEVAEELGMYFFRPTHNLEGISKGELVFVDRAIAYMAFPQYFQPEPVLPP